MVKGTKTNYLLGALLVVVIALAVVSVYYMTKPAAIVTVTPGQTTFDLTVPLHFVISDKYGGSVMTTGVNKTIYDTNLNQKEVIGSVLLYQANSSNIYAPGTQLWVKLDEKNGAGVTWFIYYQITVQKLPSQDSTLNQVPLDFYALGNYTWVCTLPNGSSLASGAHTKALAYNCSGTGSTLYPTFTMTLVENETTANYGLMNTQDPIYGYNREPVVQIEMYAFNGSFSGANRLLLTSVPLQYAVSSTDKFYGMALDPSILVRQANPDGSIKSPGMTSFPLSFNAAGLQGTDAVAVDLNLYLFSNLNYMKTYGAHPVGYTSGTSLQYNMTILYSAWA